MKLNKFTIRKQLISLSRYAISTSYYITSLLILSNYTINITAEAAGKKKIEVCYGITSLFHSSYVHFLVYFSEFFVHSERVLRGSDFSECFQERYDNFLGR
jgi:hypothetical protein